MAVRYTFGDIAVDSATQEIRRGGEPVHVERQVFAVIEYLIAHRDRVVPKIELLDEIWGNRFVSESALTSRIKSARQACGDNGRDQTVIRTIHGVGYRFVAPLASEAAGATPDAATAPGRPRLEDGGEHPSGGLIVGGLVGRRREVAEVDALAAQAAFGRRAAVFVTGPAGIGKSTFVAAAAERICDPSGWHLLRGQTLRPRGAVEPYFPILDALGRAARAGDDAVAVALDRVAPMWLAQLPSITTPESEARLERRLLGANPDRMVREGVELIEELARSGPVALVVEDLHWADQCTLDVIDLLLQRSEPCRLIVVATARNEWSPAADLIRSRVAAGQAAHIELGGLGPDELDQLVLESFGGAEVPEHVLEVVRRRSDGIPLFALEILRGWRRQGHLGVAEGGVWCTARPAELESHVPDNLRQLVEHELAHLDARTTTLLEMAAVVGTSFDAASVAAALGEPVDPVDAELTDLARRSHQIVAVDGSRWPDGTTSTRFEFAHDLFRQVLHDRIAVHAAARSHRAVGLALEAGFADRADDLAGSLAEHFVAAGDHVRAVEYLRTVGETSARKNAFVAAAGALLDALAHVEELPPGPQRDEAELRVRLALGPPLVATRGWHGAEVAENYERALELCSPETHGPELAVARYALATVTELRGEYARTEQLLAPLVAGAGAGEVFGDGSRRPDPRVVATVGTEATELLACSTFHQGKFELSLDMATAVVEGWDGTSASEVMSRLAEHPVSSCCSWASLAAWCLGRSEESLRLAERAIAVGEEHLYALSTARVQRALLHQLRHEPDECRRWATAGRDLARAQGFPMRAVQAEMLLGWADAVSGVEGATGQIRSALDDYHATGARLAEPYFVGLLAEAELVSGRPEVAVTVGARALAEMTRGSRTFFAAPELHRIAARALAACGRDDEARVHRERAVDAARQLGSPVLELRALLDTSPGDRADADAAARVAELSAQLGDDVGRGLGPV